MLVSASTVDTYVARVRGKLGVGNKAELTLAAAQLTMFGSARLSPPQPASVRLVDPGADPGGVREAEFPVAAQRFQP